jgi:hypothetical protein
MTPNSTSYLPVSPRKNPRRMIGEIAVRSALLLAAKRWPPRKKSAEVARRSADRPNFPANCLMVGLSLVDISTSFKLN